jgi:hypothetical protein
MNSTSNAVSSQIGLCLIEYRFRKPDQHANAVHGWMRSGAFPPSGVAQEVADEFLRWAGDEITVFEYRIASRGAQGGNV